MFDYSKSTLALLALSYSEGTAEQKKDILTKISPEDIFDLKFKGVFNNDLTESIKNTVKGISYILSELDSANVRLLSVYDEEYPNSLKNIDNPPNLLYLRGNADLLATKMIAVVGTRRPTRYGVKVTEDFTKAFAQNSLTVVSGFARGLDSVSHRVCVSLSKPTVAVFACGLDVCYPAENKSLYSEILNSGGLLVSEYRLGVKPLQFHFPERNRIITGLSDGVFLAEASLKSGSLISARLAVEQGKELFVVPGNINSEASEGTNALIKEMQGAVVISPEDVLERMGISPFKEETDTVQLSVTAQLVVNALYVGELHFEEILEAVKVSASELSAVLTELEIMGVVQKLNGNYYALA